ncbi:huntingtin-like isoform X1 [Daphnia carinata]|uniref:huntingtin-like isoform X1 n=1 Tax=Daphnia carinata TaxID=120202 RepID=UPI00257AA08B|nr:huntingtin-like isoform X1 [Daphnia carinata]
MASLEKLIRALDQLQITEISNLDTSIKKKEIKTYVLNIVEFNCSTNVQNHKDFVSYIASSIDSLIRLCDSKDSDIRLASDEGLYKVIKALLPLHSNRILVELCKQIKKNESPRILKLSMNRFAELCHLARPQKRRAYLANLFNAISVIANRKEEMLHESLSNFVSKVFSVMGIFAFENETKILLKGFLSNLSSKSSIIRRCAANAITVIISTNRKSDVLLALVVEYLTDQILLSEDIAMADMSVITGTLLTLKLLLPVFPSPSVPVKENNNLYLGSQHSKSAATMNAVAVERIVQIFELGVHYSFSSDHNVVNAALELLQQLLKMRTLLLAIPALKSANGLQGTRISLRGLSKENSQWNLTALPVAEESLLLEADVHLVEFEKTNLDSTEIDVEIAEDSIITVGGDEQDELLKSAALLESDILPAEKDLEETDVEQESCDVVDAPKVIDIGSLYDKTGCSPLLYCARHLSYSFLLSERKGQMKSDRSVRVSVKSLALNCLAQVGCLEPLIWNSYLSDSERNTDDSIAIIDVLQYRTHEDPQLRGQVSLLACMVLSSVISGFNLTGIESKTLVRIIDETLKDREAAASRLALQGLQHFLPMALEGSFCVETTPLLRSLLKLAENPYWLVRVDLLEVFTSFSWAALEFGIQNKTSFSLPMFQEAFLRKVAFTMIGDEDQRVRSAVANCIKCLVESWTTTRSPPSVIRLKSLASACNFSHQKLSSKTFAGVPLSINGLADAYCDSPVNGNIVGNLAYFVDELFKLLVSSNSKFVKVGCLQALADLSRSYPPATYLEIYGCSSKGSCSLLKVCIALMTNSTLMLDLATHQSLITLSTQLFAGCVKVDLNAPESETEDKEWHFLTGPLATTASYLLSHISRILNAFCCVLDDVNPLSVSIKAPLVTLPNPSALSPIRRKLRASEGPILDKEDKSDEFARKSKPHILNPSNIGFFAAQSLYVKLYELLKSTNATCKLSFDTVTSERLSSFIQSTLKALAALVEVYNFQDIGKHSEEILNYLRIIITVEPVYCLQAVQQLLKALFGTNLAAVWYDEATRFKRGCISPSFSVTMKKDQSVSLSYGFDDYLYRDTVRQMNFNLTGERPSLITKFRTSVNKIGPDKNALTSYIRLFEPMVIKALKLYTVTSCPHVQKQVLDLLCELIHLCVNYCLLDADQVFLNFVIQQFEFLEEGFIPQVETLLPSMFRFLSLLSYDRFHSKTIISVPRIMQLAGGLMATGKDAELHVLPTLRPMVEDLFLSRERMSDNFKELETQKEVLINILLRLLQYHKVYPLITAILLQVQFENASKWKSLSKQICDALIPHLNKHSLFLDSDEALQMLYKLISHMDPPVVHESLLGLLQTFTPKQSEDVHSSATLNYHRVLACRLTVFKTLISVFDEAFLLDCLNEFNLSYLINQRSDPLNVTPTENSPPDHILSSLLVDTLRLAFSHWKSKIFADSCGSTLISWKIDCFSFSVHLVLDLIALCHQLVNAEDFPVLRTAIRAELAREECKYPLFEVARELIPNNPIVFARFCALLSPEIHCFEANNMQQFFTGLNGSIAEAGYFLVLLGNMRKQEEKLEAFISVHADLILSYCSETPVKKFFENLVVDKNLIKPLVKCVLAKNGISLVAAAVSLFNIIEALQIANVEDILLEVVSSFQSISNGVVHKKLEKLLLKLNFACAESHLQCLKKAQEIILLSKNERWYLELMTKHSASPARKLETLCVIDKAFLLEFALNRNLEPIMWQEIVNLINLDDLPKLFNNYSFLSFAVETGRKSKPDIFFRVKTNFLNMIDTQALDNIKILSVAHVLSEMCKTIQPSEVKDIFSPSEISILAKMTLIFMAAMDSLQRSLVLLPASSAIVSVFGLELPSVWTNRDTLPAVYKAIDTLESLCIRLRNNTTLEHPSVTGLEHMNCPDPNFVSGAQQLGRIVTFLEQETHIPEVLHKDLLSIAIAFCRMPLFYSYTCIPPSVWNKGWNPVLAFDVERITLDLPIVPSYFLHDEIVLKEFIFRIERIRWITKKKFEEIWMTFLGILNLQNEDNVRPEEQASVIQATCEAVHALTMVLQKNLPFRTSNPAPSANNLDKIPDFMHTERGKKLKELCTLLSDDCNATSSCNSIYYFNRLSFRHIQRNIDQGSPSKKKAASPEEITDIDIQSCVRFLVDLYSQWLQSSTTPYPLLVDLFRSLLHISDFFVDTQQFDWLLDNSLALYKQLLPDDPTSLESALTGCILKSASFTTLNSEYWDLIRKHCEASLYSQHISTRGSGLDGLLYLLQKLTRNPDLARTSSLVNLAMDYVGKWLNAENSGPTWYQSVVWSMAFYCGEHFAVLPYQHNAVVDFVVQIAIGWLVQNPQQPTEIQKEILKGLERLGILGLLTPTWRFTVKREVLAIIRNVDRDQILKAALRTLLSLVYSDFGSQLYQPGADPETMLAAMEWVGALFQRMKRGTDKEAEILGQIMPVITCDIFPPADILNRILSEFMTAKPTVACCLTPTIFKVFGAARSQGQQSLVVEWILLSLSNFTRNLSDESANSVWNILCFFTAASSNPWLQSVFPLVNQPVNPSSPMEVEIFVASALDFGNQLDDQQRSTLVSIFFSARDNSTFFEAVDVALKSL